MAVVPVSPRQRSIQTLNRAIHKRTLGRRQKPRLASKRAIPNRAVDHHHRQVHRNRDERQRRVYHDPDQNRLIHHARHHPRIIIGIIGF